ncbi:MAG TPA: ParB N-terminal domain-containing protein [Spirochaetia bacterium]|nr:ParB N-terminal domain-containing protein [Spirochaetia bacterium]
MQMRIDEIIIRKRVRRDLGDISQLMESMKNHGLLNPIVVTSEKELIAGFRRLESAKRLGWKTIEVQVISKPTDYDRLEMEIDENVFRKNLTADELADGYTRLERLKNPGLLLRLWKAIVRFFKRLFSLFSRRK